MKGGGDHPPPAILVIRSGLPLSAGKSFQVLLEARAVVDVGDLRAEQVTLADVWTGEPFASDRTHFHFDRTARNVQRQIQTVRAATESFVDDCRR